MRIVTAVRWMFWKWKWWSKEVWGNLGDHLVASLGQLGVPFWTTWWRLWDRSGCHYDWGRLEGLFDPPRRQLWTRRLWNFWRWCTRLATKGDNRIKFELIWETILSISDESKFQKFGKLEKFWILLTKLAVQLDHIISTVGINISPTIILRLTIWNHHQ